MKILHALRFVICGAFVLGATLLCACDGGAADSRAARALFVSELQWKEDQPWFGGWSGLELSADGGHFHAISDRGYQVSGRIERKDGQLVGVAIEHSAQLRGRRKNNICPEPKGTRDAEGLALGDDQTLFVSFESGAHHVIAIDSSGEIRGLPCHRDFPHYDYNGSLEALALDAQGNLYALPESLLQGRPGFPLYRFDGEQWHIVAHIAQQGDYVPVGADFGPQGYLYVLERQFIGIGFLSRVRRFDLTVGDLTMGANAATPLEGETLLQTLPGERDNLEAIAVWQDPEGRTRLTMLSDDNFRLVQVTEFVEYVVQP